MGIQNYRVYKPLRLIYTNFMEFRTKCLKGIKAYTRPISGPILHLAFLNSFFSFFKNSLAYLKSDLRVNERLKIAMVHLKNIFFALKNALA